MYLNTQYSKLREFRETILQEKLDWEHDKQKLESLFYATYKPGTLVSLDVGGTHRIKTTLELLTTPKGSLLEKMFSGHHNVP